MKIEINVPSDSIDKPRELRFKAYLAKLMKEIDGDLPDGAYATLEVEYYN